MPHIATLVPQLMQKGDLTAAVNRLSMEEVDHDGGASSDIFRFSGGQRSANRRGRNNTFNKERLKKLDLGNKKVICFHCQNLNKELSLSSKARQVFLSLSLSQKCQKNTTLRGEQSL